MDNINQERNSSVELFRILATILVLVVHFNGWFVAIPQNFTLDYPKFRIPQLLIESFSCVCVNCFLVITGFYGVRLKIKSIWNLYVLLIGIYIPFYLCDSYIHNSFSMSAFLSNFLACTKESYFVNCYIMLIIISPILNAFVEKYGKVIFRYVVWLIFIEFYVDLVRENSSIGINSGYSLLHFIFMYLLSRCCYFYFDKLRSKRQIYWFLGYVLGSILVAFMYMIIGKKAFSYSNPIVIFSAVSLFLVFAKKNMYNKTINKIAKSSFAVYIIHTCPPVITFLWSYDNFLISNNSYLMYLLKIFFSIISVFILSVLYDKIRLFCMKPIYRLGDKVIDKLQNKGVLF